MSKKKRRQLLGLLIVLAIAAALLLGVILFNRHEEAAQAAAEEAGQISTGLAADPTELRWSLNGAEVDLRCDSGGTWSWAEDSALPLNNSLAQSITSALKNPAVQEMDAADTPEAYGLAEPSATIETVDADGNTARLLLGGSFTNSDNDGSTETYHYAQLEGSDKILLLDDTLVSQLTDSIYALADTAVLPTLSQDQVTSLTISGAQTTTFTVQAVETENEDGETMTEYHWYVDGTDVTDSALLGNLKAATLKCPFTAMADWTNDAAAMVRYGLDQPITVTVNYTDSEGNAATQTLSIGSLTGEGNNYYCSANGGKGVYLAGVASLSDVVDVATDGFDAATEAN